MTNEQARIDREECTFDQIVNRGTRMYVRLAAIAQAVAEGLRFQNVHQATP